MRKSTLDGWVFVGKFIKINFRFDCFKVKIRGWSSISDEDSLYLLFWYLKGVEVLNVVVVLILIKIHSGECF